MGLYQSCANVPKRGTIHCHCHQLSNLTMMANTPDQVWVNKTPFLPLAEDTPNAALTNKVDTTVETTQENTEVCTRSGCTVSPTLRYMDSMTQCEQGLVAWEILMDQDDSELIPTSKSQHEIQQQMTDPIAFCCINKPRHPVHISGYACTRSQQIHRSHGH